MLIKCFYKYSQRPGSLKTPAPSFQTSLWSEEEKKTGWTWRLLLPPAYFTLLSQAHILSSFVKNFAKEECVLEMWMASIKRLSCTATLRLDDGPPVGHFIVLLEKRMIHAWLHLKVALCPVRHSFIILILMNGRWPDFQHFIVVDSRNSLSREVGIELWIGHWGCRVTGTGSLMNICSECRFFCAFFYLFICSNQ